MKNKGFTLVEVLVSMALLMSFIAGLMGLTQMSIRASSRGRMKARVETILNKTMEEVMAVRASNFGSLDEGSFYPKSVAGSWTLVAGDEDLGDVSRRVEITRVQREVSCGGERVCPIVESGGVVDPVTFKAKVKVEWQEDGETKEEELESLLSFWR